jgi:hypothetical protein
MIDILENGPKDWVGLGASGTVLASDVKAALRTVGVADRLLVVVAPDFDGYMAELVAGLQDACARGEAGRCALLVPLGMAKEARLRGESGSFRVFDARDAAEQWLLD